MANASKSWAALFFVLRLALGLALLWWLFSAGLLDLDLLATLAQKPDVLIAEVILAFLTMPLAALRWHMLLVAQGFAFPFMQTLRIVMVSYFIGSFLPGAVGVDVVRAVLVLSSTRERKTRLLLILIMDRLFGLFGLLAVGLITVAAHSSRAIETLGLPTVVVWVALVFAIPVLVLNGHGIVRLCRRYLPFLGERVTRIIDELASALELSASKPGVALVAVAISILIFLMVLAMLVISATPLHVETLSGYDYALAGSWSLLANILPITPNGLGVGESVFAHLCSLLSGDSEQPYGSVFLTVRVVTLVAFLPGLFAYMTYRNQMIKADDPG